jgi:hypothetical protein
MSAGLPGERLRFSGLENPRKRKAGERAGNFTILQINHRKQGRAQCRAF